MLRGYLASLCLAAAAVSGAAADQKVLGGTGTTGAARPRPNVVFVLTDDQDVQLDSLEYMPYVRKHLIEKGTTYNKHYCTTAVCCPSRVTLWTGRAAHNTNVTDVNPPFGGYPKFVEGGFNDKYLPVWLQQAGYNTYYTGKLFNVHTVENYNSPYPAGFTGTEFLLDPGTYNYLNSTFQHNTDEPVNHEGEYSTDVLARKAYGLLDEAVAADGPFFLAVAPNAPHGNIAMSGSALSDDPVFVHSAPVPAKRHEHLFEGVRVPRTENFNPGEPSGANWVRDLHQQNQTNVDYNDHYYRQRLRALQGVDELVDGLLARLEAHGVLGDTYVVYSSDNGFHIGQHRLQPGKSCGYEEDINIPLIIRGPGVAAGLSTDVVTTHTDLAPTFFELLGIPLRPEFDGSPIPVSEGAIAEVEALESRREHVGVEYWGFAGSEGIYTYTPGVVMNNTYKAIRLVGSGYNLYYSIWCNNEHELYNMDVDPGQLNNLLLPSDPETIVHPQRAEQTILGTPISKLVARLDSLLFVLKSCKAEVCRRPWEALHPDGDVRALGDALAARFDAFYEREQVRVRFGRCEVGYFPASEGPQFEVDGLVFRGGLSWDQWT